MGGRPPVVDTCLCWALGGLCRGPQSLLPSHPEEPSQGPAAAWPQPQAQGLALMEWIAKPAQCLGECLGLPLALGQVELGGLCPHQGQLSCPTDAPGGPSRRYRGDQPQARGGIAHKQC